MDCWRYWDHPFISYIREHPILDKQVHFYYSFRGDENAVYLDLLRNYAQKNPNFELHLIDSTKDGYLNFEQKSARTCNRLYVWSYFYDEGTCQTD